MEYYGNHNELDQNRFKMIRVEEDLTPLLSRIRQHIEESKFDWILCLN